jgi:hypothetical protein
MGIRMTLDDGTVFEVDTPAEAAELHRVLARKQSATNAATARWGKAVKPPAKTTPANGVNPLAVVLWSAYPKGLTSDEMAKAIKVKPTSLVPMWGHLKNWIASVTNGHLSFELVVDRKPNPEGSGSIFTLTKAGNELIEGIRKES